MSAVPGVQWRALGPYNANNASKTGLLDETRRFLLAYGRLGEVAAARAELLGGGLPQRSRETRANIVQVIQARLVRWAPPAWALDELAGFAADEDGDALRAALLLHVPRQDRLLYDVVQEVIAGRWREGARDGHKTPV